MTSSKKVHVWRPKRDPVGRVQQAPSPPLGSEGEHESPEVLPRSWMQMRALVDDLRAKAEARDAESLTGVLGGIARAAAKKLRGRMDADRALQSTMSMFIEMAASRYALDPGEQWKPGEPLKLLLAGYSGTRNTGADVRVEEMIRQFRHLFGDEHVALSILTIDPELTRGYFRTVRQLHLPKLFPKFLFDTVHEQHAVIACEGSMFKSKFANALSTSMVGALGLASAEGKLAVGYGGEAGKMDRSLQDLVARYCREALIIARNEASKDVLAALGVQSRSGTDTAWTFDPAPLDEGRALLIDAGWDGETPILALCPINPFWWPVKPDVARAAVNSFSGMYDDEHYGSIYFHAEGAEVEDAQVRYVTAIATAVRRFQEALRANGKDVFPVMFGSEQLDRGACEALNDRLGGQWPVVVSDEHDMYAMVSAMRNATFMVSSRYHAIVTTMPGGVLSAGITMDERIRNLMADRGTPHLALEVDDPQLEDHLLTVLHTLEQDREVIAEGIDRCVHANLERMGRMGQILVDYVRARHPEFPFSSELGEHGDPWDHLPSLPPAVCALVERVRGRSEAPRPQALQATA